MSGLHDRIERLGRQAALALVDTNNDRAAFDAAVKFMGDEDSTTGFLFSGWCQTALPHKRLLDDQIWSLESDYVKLMIEPGSMRDEHDKPRRIGVPFGSRARLILLYLQSEAIRTNSPEVELGKSLRSWLKKLNVPQGGKSIAEVREQANRISRCRMTFEIRQGKQTGLINQNIIDTAMFTDEAGGSLLETARLSDTFFTQLKKHPVPLQESAIRAISNNSMALDIYCWLAYRLHSLSAPCPITWRALSVQFGAGYDRLRRFRERFIEMIDIATAVYPEAKLELTESGITLYPSPAPVPHRKSSAGTTLRVVSSS